jgi:hypothetical protein
VPDDRLTELALCEVVASTSFGELSCVLQVSIVDAVLLHHFSVAVPLELRRGAALAFLPGAHTYVPLLSFRAEVQLAYVDSGRPVFVVVSDLSPLPAAGTIQVLLSSGLELVEPLPDVNCERYVLNSSVASRKRRCRRRAPPAQRSIGSGCWPTEVAGLAGRLRTVWPAHGRKWVVVIPRGGVAWAPICARVWPHSSGVRPLTGVRLVRNTSVDPRRRLSGRVSVLCAAHVAAPLFLEPLPCCLPQRNGPVPTARYTVCADRASRVRSRAGTGGKQGKRES